jgi:hypothetical protein
LPHQMRRAMGRTQPRRVDNVQHLARKNEEFQRIRGETMGTIGGGSASTFGDRNMVSDADSPTSTKRLHEYQSYYRQVRQTHTASPIVERLLKQYSPSMRFEVRDHQGKPRVVSLRDGLDRYYEQFASGEAKVLKGPQDMVGETMRYMTQQETTQSAGESKAAAEIRKAEPGEMGRGRSERSDEALKHWRAAHKDESDVSQHGKITIAATPELRRMFRIFQSSDPYHSSRINVAPPDPSQDPTTAPSG